MKVSTAALFVEEARKLKGARWRHRGRKPWALDCIGLIVVAGANAGLQWADETGYGREPWEDRLRAGCRARWGEPVTGDRQPGDVVLIRWAEGEPSHIAIVGDHPDGGLSLIHAHTMYGVVENGLSGRFPAYIVETYRPVFDT